MKAIEQHKRLFFTWCSLIYSPGKESESLNCFTIRFERVYKFKNNGDCELQQRNTQEISELIVSSMKPEDHCRNGSI
ncbi:hypothetical protein F2Q69_00037671 [Brassica cretica]|uniref:Uncharacterized protein n=1 Tax=Brassica cretica TaxID=69181 RepID=A0A8S9SQL4_BRACR|nr:hypothetical protein F2Q69_00037671 [Brassica cretica]